MKILTIEQSMVTLLGVASRSGGTLYSLEILSEFAARYNFAMLPNVNELTTSPTKIEFKLGRFDNYQINALEIYNDGIVVRASVDTDIIDRFLADVLNYVAEKWNVSLIRANIVDRMYQSVITFASDKDVLAPINAAKPLMTAIRDGVKSATGFDAQFASAGFVLSVDEASIPSMKPTAFRIERRVGIEFQFNHYFSAAPLRTGDHVAALEKWEASV